MAPTPAERSIARFLELNGDVVAYGAAKAMAGDERLATMGAPRGLSSSELVARAGGFMVDALRTDLALGTDAAVRHGLTWTATMAGAQGLRPPLDLYHDLFNAIFASIARALPNPELRPTLDAYRLRVSALIGETEGPDAGVSRGEGSCLIPPAPTSEMDTYLEHLLDGDDEQCLAATEAYRGHGLGGLHRLYVGLIQPTQYRVGELWETGKISVATEHLATATNTLVALAHYAPLAPAHVDGQRAMIACVPDELHELGARLTACLLECDGWRVDYYGASMPLPDLIGAITARRPRMVCLSAALPSNLGIVQSTIGSIRDTLGRETPPIVVGGNAFRLDPTLWKAAGADRWSADASEAVELLREFKK